MVIIKLYDSLDIVMYGDMVVGFRDNLTRHMINRTEFLSLFKSSNGLGAEILRMSALTQMGEDAICPYCGCWINWETGKCDDHCVGDYK